MVMRFATMNVNDRLSGVYSYFTPYFAIAQ